MITKSICTRFKMKTLIFETTVTGHHLEYLQHYYRGALTHPDEEYIFVVTRKFEDVKDKYEWQPSDHISIQYIDSKYDPYFTSPNFYILGWKTSLVLRDYVKAVNPDKVILTILMQFIPFICLLLPNKVRVRGIMYKIYLYEKERMSRMRLLAEKLRFWIASKSRVIESIFVLNDRDSARALNKTYHTEKFKFIPDPVPEVDLACCKNLRTELGISSENKVYLHFGGLDKRKGTLEILRAIELSTDSELEGKTFAFAGRFSESLRKEFYPLLEKVRHKTQILVFDEFCSYEFLYSLCHTCDIILMPYQTTNLSSGVLGYASVFGKPVIGPSQGLIGNIIRQYKMGLALNDVKAPGIRDSLAQSLALQDSSYADNNRLEHFIETIV